MTTSAKEGAAWIWYGLIAAVTVIAALALFAALIRPHTSVNQGPPNEAAPGRNPARDIDRSRAP